MIDEIKELWDIEEPQTPLENAKDWLVFQGTMLMLGIANYLFVRPAEWVIGFERKDRTAYGLLKALYRNDRLDRWGLRGWANIVAFGQYLKEAEADTARFRRIDLLSVIKGWKHAD